MDKKRLNGEGFDPSKSMAGDDSTSDKKAFFWFIVIVIGACVFGPYLPALVNAFFR